MTGHSFGGATTLLALHSDPRFKAGIVLDGWLYPLRDMKNLNLGNRSVMFVNAEGFLNLENLQKMQKFADDNNGNDKNENAKSVQRLCHYIHGSVHQNFIDVPFMIRVSFEKFRDFSATYNSKFKLSRETKNWREKHEIKFFSREIYIFVCKVRFFRKSMKIKSSRKNRENFNIFGAKRDNSNFLLQPKFA